MQVYIVTCFYKHNDGRTVEAVAIVGAKSPESAIEIGARAVLEFPHCADLLGGMCEPLPDGMSPEEAAGQRAHRPADATVH